ncbi:MAG: trypsin-like peptidase domain-containing protein [Phycisphaerales bacterium]|nr:trypsin-like peptidase domain-containing protein [Phycisphaerales bacterium]
MLHIISISLSAAVLLGASDQVTQDSPGVAAAVEAAEQLSLAFGSAADRIKPSVVKIAITDAVSMRRGPWSRGRGRMTVQATASGVILSADGHVLTNAHVVQDADVINVILHDGRRVEATPVGLDAGADLAVLQIEATNLQPAELAHTQNARIGQWVLAVGSPYGLGHSFSAGIVSATGRSNLGLSEFEHLIQTDAAINPGNSGGPLVDLRGRVIGINVAIKTNTGDSSGVGFAVPADMVHRVASSLINYGTVQRGFFGVRLWDRDPNDEATVDADTPLCVIRGVVADMPAQKAGLLSGDLLIRINDRAIRSAADARHAIATAPPGKACRVQVQRDDEMIQTTVYPADRNTSLP